MSLIDADALMKDLEKWMKQVDPTHPQEDNAIPPMEDIIVSTLMTIEEQPTIEERKKGKWIYGEHDIAMCDGYRCDKCGFFVPWDYRFTFIDFINDYHFCPNCGADMRGDENDT